MLSKMSEKAPSRMKSRRAVIETPTASSETEPSWTEAIIAPGGACGLQSGGRDADMSFTEVLALHRRCFSCCNTMLKQYASVEGDGRMMLLEQTKFTSHPLMKAIVQRVSEQTYTDMKTFVADITRLLDACVAPHERKAVLDAVGAHVEKSGQSDARRASKLMQHLDLQRQKRNTFSYWKAVHACQSPRVNVGDTQLAALGARIASGFPNALLEEMLAQTASARKKLPPGGAVHSYVDVGRFFARAYGLGLSRGARFCGEVSQDKEFFEMRKKREAEFAQEISEREAAIANRAQKKSKLADKQTDLPKKQKFTPAPAIGAVVRKPTRGLRATRRQSVEDSSLCARPIIEANLPPRNEPSAGTSKPRGVPRRLKPRLKVHCHHLQGQIIEMDDKDWRGLGYTGRLEGTSIWCGCGCGTALSGSHWLMHNGGRANNRQPGYPYRYMRLRSTRENLMVHYEKCSCHGQLCDTCNSWEAPGAEMVSCMICRTSVHATEECALRVISPSAESSAGSASTAPREESPPHQPVAAGDGDAPSKIENGNGGSGGGGEIGYKSQPSPTSRSPPNEDAHPPNGTAAHAKSCRGKAPADQDSHGDGDASSAKDGAAGPSNDSDDGSIDVGAGGAGGVEESVWWKCQICARSGATH